MGVLSTVGGAAAMMGAAGIGSSVLSNVSNKNIAQQNNAFNEKMLQKQMDYNTKMYNQQLGDTWAFYNDQKQYNSAEAQVQRLREAGLNPALAMQGQGGGSISSMTSPSAQGINPPTASPYTADYNSIGDAVGKSIGIYNELKNSEAERDIKKAQETQINIENKYWAQKLVADITQTIEQTKDVKVKRQMQEQLKRVYGDMLTLDIDSKRQSLANMREAFNGAVLDNAMKRLQLEVYPQQVKVDLAQKTASIASLYAQRQMTLNQAKTELFKQAEISARSAGLRLSNYQLQKTVDNLIQQVRLSTVKLYNNVGPDGFQGIWNMMYNGLDSFYDVKDNSFK